jgi:hypothetical protein
VCRTSEMIHVELHRFRNETQRYLKKGEQTLRMCSTPLNQQIAPVSSCSIVNVCCDVGEEIFISEANPILASHAYLQNVRLCVSQKNVLFPKLTVSLKSPEQHSLFFVLIPLKSLFASDYSTTSDVPPAKNQVITINKACRSIGRASTPFPL